MSLRTLLKRDIANREHTIAQSKHLIDRWRHELATAPSTLTIPLPRAGVDYAYGTPDLGRLKAAGNTFICRYLGGDPAKDLTPKEALRLSHAGFDLITVFEETAQRALGGLPAGVTDAVHAQELLNKIGAPHAAIYFACDWDVQPDQVPSIRAYFKGATEQLGHYRVGVYGGYAVVHELMSLDNIRYGWQTYAWSQGRWTPHAQLRQIQNGVKLAGVECDLDRAVAADFGQWRLI